MKSYVRKLQVVELNIMKEIDKICKEYDIEYFLCGGSLLGAVRHKGFIPWDDDMDIVMTRKNYNKFIKIAPKYIDDSYFIDCYELNKKCCFSYMKVKKKNTMYVEEKNKDFYDEDSCIWVDVFPVDGIKNPLSRMQQILFKLSKYISTFISIKNGSNYYQNSMIKKKIYGFILKFVPFKFLVFMFNRIVCFYDEDKVDYLFSFSGVYSMEKETFSKSKLFPYKNIEFEDCVFSGVMGCDYYLTQLYGDYMKLPPKEKRVNHKPYMIKFEDGEELHFRKDGEKNEKKI